VVLEAFAAGVPVIASRIGALSELVENDVTGVLVEPGSPADLARALRLLAGDPELSVRLGRNARRVYERQYTKEQAARALLSVYDQTIRRKRAE
jgi:glycosyltransferase involved in cell wall biosynthesis